MSPFKTSWHFYQGQALLSVWGGEGGKRGAGLDISAGALISSSICILKMLKPSLSVVVLGQLCRTRSGDRGQLRSVFQSCSEIPKYSGHVCLLADEQDSHLFECGGFCLKGRRESGFVAVMGAGPAQQASLFSACFVL